VHPTPIMLVALLALNGSMAGAQTVYRCGNSYSQQPCPGGSEVPSADPRTLGEAQRATRVANADARLADQMEKARLAQEKNAPRALIIGPQTPVKEEAKKESSKPKRKADELSAVSPRPPHEAKKKTKKKKTA
jgi:hypothetical protein